TATVNAGGNLGGTMARLLACASRSLTGSASTWDHRPPRSSVRRAFAELLQLPRAHGQPLRPARIGGLEVDIDRGQISIDADDLTLEMRGLDSSHGCRLGMHEANPVSQRKIVDCMIHRALPEVISWRQKQGLRLNAAPRQLSVRP